MLNIEKILEQVKDYPQDIKDAALRYVFAAVQGSAAVEKTSLSQVTNERDQARMTIVQKSVGNEQEYTAPQFVQDMVGGQVTEATKAYAKRFNIIIEKSIEIEKKINSNAFIIAEDGSLIIDTARMYLNESEYKAKFDASSHKNQEEIIMSVENKPRLLNDHQFFDIKRGAVQPDWFYPVLFSQKINPNLEKSVTQVIIRDIGDDKIFKGEIFTNIKYNTLNKTNIENTFFHDKLILNKLTNEGEETFIFTVNEIQNLENINNNYKLTILYSI